MNAKYKLVPVEPTPEMVEAAADAYMPFGDMELALRMAIYAAPEVEQKPVAKVVWSEAHGRRAFMQYGHYSTPRLLKGAMLYLHPQPAPEVAQLVEALEVIAKHPYSRDDELGYPKCREIARNALAAYRNEGKE